MTPQQVRAYVAEYRRLAGLVRGIRARQLAYRGQRSSSTIMGHVNEMIEIQDRLKSAGHTKIEGMLRTWHEELQRAVRYSNSSHEEKSHRAIAREASRSINKALEMIK